MNFELLKNFGLLVLFGPVGVVGLWAVVASDNNLLMKILMGGLALLWTMGSIIAVFEIFGNLRDLQRGPIKLEGFIADMPTKDTRHQTETDSESIESKYLLRVADHSYEESPRFHNNDIEVVQEARSIYDEWEFEWDGTIGLYEFQVSEKIHDWLGVGDEVEILYFPSSDIVVSVDMVRRAD